MNKLFHALTNLMEVGLEKDLTKESIRLVHRMFVEYQSEFKAQIANQYASNGKSVRSAVYEVAKTFLEKKNCINKYIKEKEKHTQLAMLEDYKMLVNLAFLIIFLSCIGNIYYSIKWSEKKSHKRGSNYISGANFWVNFIYGIIEQLPIKIKKYLLITQSILILILLIFLYYIYFSR